MDARTEDLVTMARGAVHPVHPSVMAAPRGRVKPYNMDTITVSREMIEGMQKIALDIFADMVNAGQPFQEALAAIYLSGLQHGSAITGDE